MPQPAMKYIIFGDAEGYEYPVLFPTIWSHQEVAEALGRPSTHIVSAGFVHTDAAGAFVCSLRSQSLGIGSRPDHDPAVIAAWLSSR